MRDIDSLMRFLDRSVTCFHAVAEVREALLAAGFREHDEREIWRTAPGDRGFVVRNLSGIVAFRIGGRPADGFRIATAHVDSPGLKVKWEGAATGHGFLELPVAVYGSPIHSTWLDRPLAIAGRLVRVEDGAVRQTLVRSAPGLATIPNLAIHMNRAMNKGVEYNPQTQLTAFCGETTLPEVIASLGIDRPEDVRPWQLECFLVDSSPAVLLGQCREWLQSPRLDNLASCFAEVQALLEAGASPERTQVVFLADNEEIGSLSAAGANSCFLRDTLDRLLPEDADPRQGLLRALARSAMVSADAAHASHPGYPDSYDHSFTCRLNQGPVIKSNCNLSYSTNAESQAVLQDLCRRNHIPLQDFQAPSDKGCGTTVGPMSSARLGVTATDLGVPMWSMHSSRETAGVRDQAWLKDALRLFLEN